MEPGDQNWTICPWKELSDAPDFFRVMPVSGGGVRGIRCDHWSDNLRCRRSSAFSSLNWGITLALLNWGITLALLNWGITRPARTLDLASSLPYRHIADQSVGRVEEQKHRLYHLGIGVTKTIGHPSSTSKLWVPQVHRRTKVGPGLSFCAHTCDCNETYFWLLTNIWSKGGSRYIVYGRSTGTV